MHFVNADAGMNSYLKCMMYVRFCRLLTKTNVVIIDALNYIKGSELSIQRGLVLVGLWILHYEMI
jgi:hypothetical protein